MRRGLVVICLLFLSFAGWSQLTVTLDRDTIAMGEPVKITYDLNHNDAINNIDYSAFERVVNLAYKTDTMLLDSTATLELLKEAEISPGLIRLTGTIYHVGVYAIPFPVIDGKQATGNQKLLFVKPPQSIPGLDSLDIAPIKDIMREPISWTDYLWILNILGVLVLIGLLWWYLRRRNRKESYDSALKEVPVVDDRPAHVIALEALEKLDREELWRQESSRIFHSKLTRIMRDYLHRRYDVPIREKTSSEISDVLKTTAISRELLIDIEEILNVADIVKFAKGTSTTDLNRSFLDRAFQVVHKTKNDSAQ